MNPVRIGSILAVLWVSLWCHAAETPIRRQLYVATPGVRNYLEYGGHGLLVFDMDAQNKFVRRIPLKGLGTNGKPLNVKGICANSATHRIYVSTLQHLQCLDLHTDEILWERTYDGGCDRMAISNDGKVLFVPSLEKDHWNVVDGTTGEVLKKLIPKSKAHNTIHAPNGKEFYLAGLGSPLLRIADARTQEIVRETGPFGNFIRPFTVNGSSTRVFVCLNELLGFEVGDLKSGRPLHRVEVLGFNKGPVKRHGCPSHGIALTPDERELWLCDAANQRLHIFDATFEPPRQSAQIRLKDEPGWITISIDGKTAYPSTGDIVDIAARKVVSELRDETGAAVQSEKMVEVHWKSGRVARCGDQFGLGRVNTQ